MKKLILLLILSVACLFGVASCGKDDEPSVNPADQEKLDKATSYLKQFYKDAASETKNSYQLLANLPNATLTWSLEIVSGDANAVSLGTEPTEINGIPYYIVTIAAEPAEATAYKLTATITVGSLSSQIVYERTVPEYKSPETTIEELVTNKPTADADTIYIVTGTWTAKDGMVPSANTYGNGFLSDDKGNKITIYGLSGTDACLTYDAGVYKYSNSKDFPTLNINEGAVIKVGMVYTVKYDNYSAYLIEVISGGQQSDVLPEPAKVNTTLADLVATKPAEDNAAIYVVTGTWTAKDGMAPSDNTYGNGFLSDDKGNQVTIYGLSSSSSAVAWAGKAYVYTNSKDFPTLEINDGDVITVGMVYTVNYDNYSAYFISKGEPQADTVASILAEAATLADKAYLDGNRTLEGTVKEITDAYNSQYKNITFMLEDSTGSILVFRAKGDCAETLKAGDKVSVTGQVQNYSGTIEFVNSTITLVEAGGTDEPDQPDQPTVPSGEPAAIETTVTALAANKPSGNLNQIYIVEGIWVAKDHMAAASNTFGNGFLMDEAGNKITVYGFAPDSTALAYANGVYTYTNPKTFPTLNLDEYKVVKVAMVYTVQFNNYSVYLIEVVGDVNDATAVKLAKEALIFDETTSVNLVLPTNGVAGTTIAWASSNADVIATDGTVTRPAAGSEDATVTLTATITKGEASETATFVVTVKAEVASTGATVTTTYDFVTKFSTYASSWDSSYAQRVINSSVLGSDLPSATFTLSNANKQSGTITDRPVSASKSSATQYITVEIVDGSITAVTFNLQKWNDSKKFKSMVIEYFDGTNWVKCSTELTGGVACPASVSSNVDIPAGVTKVRLSFLGNSTSNNQLGLTSIQLTVKQ